MPEEQLARCPYCQQITLEAGYFCVFCGRMLRAAQQEGLDSSGQVYHKEKPETYKPYGGDIPGGVPFVICSYCQTPNQPWYDYCKTCKRPLQSTAKP